MPISKDWLEASIVQCTGLLPGLPHLRCHWAGGHVCRWGDARLSEALNAQNTELLFKGETTVNRIRAQWIGGLSYLCPCHLNKFCHLVVFCCHSWRRRKRLISHSWRDLGGGYHLDILRLRGMWRGSCWPNKNSKSGCCFGCVAFQMACFWRMNMKSMRYLCSPWRKIGRKAGLVCIAINWWLWTNDWKRTLFDWTPGILNK